MGFPVSDTMLNFAMTMNNIGQKIADAAQMSFEAAKFASERVQFWTSFIFDKLTWIPVATLLSIAITLFRHPLEFITRVLCAIIMSIFFVLYIILTIPPFSWIAFAVWFIIRHVLVLIGFTVIYVTIFCIVAFIFLILSLLNVNGKLSKFALCQTSPFAWFTIPNYHEGNKYERGFFCNKPCIMGYTPDELTGAVCNRLPLQQPSFCPQAEIMRLLLKKNTIGERHVYANQMLTPSYLMKLPIDKEEEYIKHFLQMQLFFDKCNRKMGTFNNIALDICSSLDAIKSSSTSLSLDDANRLRKLQEVCKQGFCNARSRHVFCSSFVDSKPENQGSGLLKAIVLMLTAMLLFVFMIVMTYKFVAASTQ